MKQKAIIGQMLIVSRHNDKILGLNGYVFPLVLIRVNHRVHLTELFPLIIQYHLFHPYPSFPFAISFPILLRSLPCPFVCFPMPSSQAYAFPLSALFRPLLLPPFIFFPLPFMQVPFFFLSFFLLFSLLFPAIYPPILSSPCQKYSLPLAFFAAFFFVFRNSYS